MMRVVGSELFKMRTTRTFYGLVIAALALVVIISVAVGLASDFDPNSNHPSNPHDVLGVGSLAQFFALVLGILAVTTEFRHGTITPSVLAVPGRARLTLGKFWASGLIGLGLGIACVGLSMVIVLAAMSARDVTTGIGSSEVINTLVGGILAVVLYAGIGVGVGAIVRNQVGAIVGTLGWLFILSPLLSIIPTVGDWISEYGPGGAANALAIASPDRDSDVMGQLPGGIVLAGYCLVFLVIGVHLMRKRDISA